MQYEIFCLNLGKNATKNKKSTNRNCSKLFSFTRTICQIKKSRCMNILILEKAVENLKTATCGSFRLYFYKNLFDPNEKSKIINHKTLNKSTLQTIINEIFSTKIEENEYLIKSFNEEYNL